jgi:CRP-like cAMP-binding protein
MDEQTLQIIALFEREPLFIGLDDEQLADIATRFQVLHLPRNTTLFTQDSPPNAFYIVFHGHVRIMHSRNGQESLLNVLDTGDYFGEIGRAHV